MILCKILSDYINILCCTYYVVVQCNLKLEKCIQRKNCGK